MSGARDNSTLLHPTAHLLAFYRPLDDSRMLCYSAPVGERGIAISLFVCLCVCLSVREHISGTAGPGPIFTKFSVQIPCGRGSVLLWRRCDTLCRPIIKTSKELSHEKFHREMHRE